MVRAFAAALFFWVATPALAEDVDLSNVNGAPPAVKPEDPDARPMDSLTLDLGQAAFINRTTLEFQRAVTDVTSAYVGAMILAGPLTRPFDGVLNKAWGFGLEMGFRFYPYKRAPTGWYFGPLANVAWTFQSNGAVANNGWSVAAGAMVGYNVWAGAFNLDLGVGALYHREQLNSGAVETLSPGQIDFPVMPTARVAIGFGF